MKHLGVYAIVVLIICALAFSGNQSFYMLASLYNYGIYIFMAAVAVIIIAYHVLNRSNA